ncbi:MAG: hypothetical protein ABIF92_01255 [archaeon]
MKRIDQYALELGDMTIKGIGRLLAKKTGRPHNLNPFCKLVDQPYTFSYISFNNLPEVLQGLTLESRPRQQKRDHIAFAMHFSQKDHYSYFFDFEKNPASTSFNSEVEDEEGIIGIAFNADLLEKVLQRALSERSVKQLVEKGTIRPEKISWEGERIGKEGDYSWRDIDGILRENEIKIPREYDAERVFGEYIFMLAVIYGIIKPRGENLIQIYHMSKRNELKPLDKLKKSYIHAIIKNSYNRKEKDLVRKTDRILFYTYYPVTQGAMRTRGIL